LKLFLEKKKVVETFLVQRVETWWNGGSAIFNLIKHVRQWPPPPPPFPSPSSSPHPFAPSNSNLHRRPTPQGFLSHATLLHHPPTTLSAWPSPAATPAATSTRRWQSRRSSKSWTPRASFSSSAPPRAWKAPQSPPQATTSPLSPHHPTPTLSSSLTVSSTLTSNASATSDTSNPTFSSAPAATSLSPPASPPSSEAPTLSSTSPTPSPASPTPFSPPSPTPSSLLSTPPSTVFPGTSVSCVATPWGSLLGTLSPRKPPSVIFFRVPTVAAGFCWCLLAPMALIQLTLQCWICTIRCWDGIVIYVSYGKLGLKPLMKWIALSRVIHACIWHRECFSKLVSAFAFCVIRLHATV